MDSKNEKLMHARRLLQALQSGDTYAEREAADAIARGQSLYLHEELHRIAGALRDALCNVHVAGELARLAHRDLPDAQLRLNQVIGLTEEAAHRTLTAVEESLPLAESMTEAVEAFRAARQARGAADVAKAPAAGSKAAKRKAASSKGVKGANSKGAADPAPAAGDDALESLLEGILGNSAALKGRLSEVMMAQSFQDITGQILRRVVDLVAELETLLGRGRDADRAARADVPRRSESAGEGPPLPAAIRAGDAVDGQQDVDDLLSELGV